jgi:two-component SAPR family response regulator
MKIIAVDDEKIALQGLILSIQKSAPNAEIYGFRHTGEAIAHMEKDPCDVAFLDIEMKGMNGVTVAEKLKAINPDVNIIFATGFGSYRDAAFDLHASGYLIKPITAESVKRELDNLRRPVTPPKRLQIFTFGNFARKK